MLHAHGIASDGAAISQPRPHGGGPARRYGGIAMTNITLNITYRMGGGHNENVDVPAPQGRLGVKRASEVE